MLFGRLVLAEFLSSIGYLPALHDKECPAYKKIIKQNSMWNPAAAGLRHCILSLQNPS